MEGNFVAVKRAALFTSTIVSKVLRMPNVVMINRTAVEGPVVHRGKINVRVMNWMITGPSSRSAMTQCPVHPNTTTVPLVVGATGYDGPNVQLIQDDP
ncbi:hypothetical protein DFH94DRAFT_753139 [Russula ochroleuca]|jgi:thiamine thiazole synthase|uniref:Uncharacterized protein n=1 Tax=Russula ochroleuca TaxID=152965 RepID=A0A9P5MT59_9AGAM|nr:hypothetical protein DFH94DRAFT_753139 [Russula ochroleuca]